MKNTIKWWVGASKLLTGSVACIFLCICVIFKYNICIEFALRHDIKKKILSFCIYIIEFTANISFYINKQRDINQAVEKRASRSACTVTQKHTDDIIKADLALRVCLCVLYNPVLAIAVKRGSTWPIQWADLTSGLNEDQSIPSHPRLPTQRLHTSYSTSDASLSDRW